MLLEEINKIKRMMVIINEDLNLFESMNNDEKYEKYYSFLDKNIYDQLINLDPTIKKDGGMGKYTDWMIKTFEKGLLKQDQFNDVTDSLKFFNKHLQLFPKKVINQYSNFDELKNAVSEIRNENGEDSKNEKREKVEVVYEDDDWKVVIPRTVEASCKLGINTKWCTASTKTTNDFHSYSKQGPLYINLNKKNGRKYQFHFETNAFGDERDKQILDPVNISMGMSKGLFDFYKKLIGDDLVDYFGSLDIERKLPNGTIITKKDLVLDKDLKFKNIVNKKQETQDGKVLTDKGYYYNNDGTMINYNVLRIFSNGAYITKDKEFYDPKNRLKIKNVIKMKDGIFYDKNEKQYDKEGNPL